MDLEKNPVLIKAVEPENDLKNWLVEYVGEQLNPEDDIVNVEMVVSVLAKEFPELLLAVAEENFFRGYQQALDDSEAIKAEACGNKKCENKKCSKKD
jgi:uncharacterized protein YdiU (UPF0061 family)